MSLDVEGHEIEVLKDMQENTFWPDYLIIEANSKKAAKEQDRYLGVYEQIHEVSVNRIFELQEEYFIYEDLLDIK